MTTASDQQAIADFLRTISRISVELADKLSPPSAPDKDQLIAGLGFLQRWIARQQGMHTDRGMAPRELTRAMNRDDEPNVRAALNGMVRTGVTERVAGTSRPMRFRMTKTFRDYVSPDGPSLLR
jgi:hypothetical protein